MGGKTRSKRGRRRALWCFVLSMMPVWGIAHSKTEPTSGELLQALRSEKIRFLNRSQEEVDAYLHNEGFAQSDLLRILYHQIRLLHEFKRQGQATRNKLRSISTGTEKFLVMGKNPLGFKLSGRQATLLQTSSAIAQVSGEAVAKYPLLNVEPLKSCLADNRKHLVQEGQAETVIDHSCQDELQTSLLQVKETILSELDKVPDEKMGTLIVNPVISSSFLAEGSDFSTIAQEELKEEISKKAWKQKAKMALLVGTMVAGIGVTIATRGAAALPVTAVLTGVDGALFADDYLRYRRQRDLSQTRAMDVGLASVEDVNRLRKAAMWSGGSFLVNVALLGVNIGRVIRGRRAMLPAHWEVGEDAGAVSHRIPKKFIVKNLKKAGVHPKYVRAFEKNFAGFLDDAQWEAYFTKREGGVAWSLVNAATDPDTGRIMLRKQALWYAMEGPQLHKNIFKAALEEAVHSQRIRSGMFNWKNVIAEEARAKIYVAKKFGSWPAEKAALVEELKIYAQRFKNAPGYETAHRFVKNIGKR